MGLNSFPHISSTGGLRVGSFVALGFSGTERYLGLSLHDHLAV